ncbi:MAG: DUF2188 domain-containing protein [Candidatus Methanoplasma sp.]|jgi:hypothetical protein|nr:DUF2188 domain-containing protein [Candidatus Methanoplasma sp.]
MNFFDRFKRKEETRGKDCKPTKADDNEVKCRDAGWAASEEKPAEECSAAADTKEEKKKEAKSMAAKKDTKVWHITKREEDGMWQVKAEGAMRATKLFKTKAEAEEHVKTLKANNEGSRVVKHKKTGKFQKK